jgi:hypothetical protein
MDDHFVMDPLCWLLQEREVLISLPIGPDLVTMSISFTGCWI